MTKDGLVDENLRTGEQKSATAAEKPEQEDSAKETAKKEADEEPIVEEERCMDAGDGEEDAPRHHSTAKQSADYYKAHQEDGKPKDAPAEADAEPQTKNGRLSFEDEKGGIVRGMGMGVKKVAKKGVDTATGYAHQKVHQVEKDNSGVEAAHKSEEAAERLHHFVKGRKKPKDKSARAEKRGGEDQKSSRLKFSESEGGTAENAAEPPLKKKQPQPPPTAAGGEAKTVGAKFYQKKQYKDAYAAAKRGQKAGTAASKQAAAATNTITEKAKAAVQEIVAQNKTLWVSIGVGILLVMVMLGAFSSCGAAIQGTGSTFVGTTYPSKDADMKGAEEDYLELEKELDKQIRQMESTHPGYDEYRYQLDEIGHDPYDLTTLQREANRYYSLSASQTLQALQELYEEKLVTYPRTDSQFVTEDMRTTVESLVLALDGQTVDVSCVINNSKVTDHHAILPTMQSVKCSKEKLSETKQRILSLIIWKLVQAVQPPFIYEDVLVTVCCQGRNFTAKYKDVLQPGYTAKPVPLVEPEKNKDASLPNDLEQGMVIPVVRAEKKQGFTSPPKVYTDVICYERGIRNRP